MDDMDSEQNVLQNTPQRMRFLVAVNGHYFTEATRFTPLSISWDSDPSLVDSKFLTQLCFFLHHKSTDRKTLVSALLFVFFLLVWVGFFLSDF